MTEEIKGLLDAMHEAASEAFYAAERFGKGSDKHLSMYGAYDLSKSLYEAACSREGIPAYVNYSYD